MLLLAQIFEAASKAVAFLGIFNYLSMHVRRNDLQYKDVFIGATTMLKNVEALVLPGETLYMATDEHDPEYFKVVYCSIKFLYELWI